MATFELRGADIDGCVRCGGTWLDSGEIEWVGAVDPADAARFALTLANAPEVRTTERRCPRCPRRLREITVGEQPRLILDRCPWGHGIWFDRGEMLTFIHTFGGEAGRPAAQFFADLYSNEVARTEGGGG